MEMAAGSGARWRRDASVVDVPKLRVGSGTAGSVAEYQSLCRKCLHDEHFAARLIEEQFSVVPRVSDPRAWWGQVREYYEVWRASAA